MSSVRDLLRIRKEKRKIIAKKKPDRFRELPDDILSHIVSHMGMRESGKASLLSSNWRQVCASRSELLFSWTMVNKPTDKLIKHPCEEFRDRYVQVVNQCLHNYQHDDVSPLNSFKILFCLDSHSTNDIDQWIHFAFSRGVKFLEIYLSCGKKRREKVLYTLRADLLSQHALNLHKLHLRSVSLGPGVIDYFHGVKDLKLKRMDLSEEQMETIQSCCLNLESFSIFNCAVPRKVCISSSLRKLKYFMVVKCKGLEDIQLSTTALTSFDCLSSPPINICSTESVNLEKMFFRAYKESGILYSFGRLANEIPQLKILSVFTTANLGERLPKKMATFSNLKKLELYCYQLKPFDLRKLTVVLNACPLLEMLYFAVKCQVKFKYGEKDEIKYKCNFSKADKCNEDEDSEDEDSEDEDNEEDDNVGELIKGLVHKHLKEIHISGFRYSSGFIMFVKYLQGYATQLQKTVIDPQPNFYTGLNRWYRYDKRSWSPDEFVKTCELFKGRFKSEFVIMY